MERNYTTWEEDLTSDRMELHGYRGELVAIIEKTGGAWVVSNAQGALIATHAYKALAQKAAEALLK